MQQNERKTLKILAKRIKKLRKEKSRSLNSFVFENGLITTATLSRIENGLVDVKFTTLVKLAQMLGINLSELFQGMVFQDFEDI